MGVFPRSERRFASAAVKLRAAVGGALALAVLSMGAAAFGEGTPAPDTRAADAPAKSATPREYMEICGQGNTKFAKHDVQGAVERYRAATTRFPDEPLAYALLGESLLALGNTAEARAALVRGAAVGEKDSGARIRSLVVLAVLEEHEQNWDAARTAWQSVLDAGKAPAGGAPATAAARVRTIDAVRQQTALADEVRKRIAATADGGVFSDPNKPTPDKGR